MRRDQFERMLPVYVNGGCFSPQDQFVALMWPAFPFQRNASLLIQKFHGFKQKDKETQPQVHQVEVTPYEGQNPHVQRMARLLNDTLADDLLGAYMHGSLATYEEVAYSDFDALVILKDEVFDHPERLARVAYCLHRARTIMLDFDPLQHHGWFVLAEAQLDAYPEHYFPLELFRYAKSLLPHNGLELRVHVQPSAQERLEAFRSLSTSIITRINAGAYPSNMYELKFLLSQFMLLPALYVQARDGAGVWKAASFDLAKRDFTPEEWESMEVVSRIRRDWSYECSPLQRRFLTSPSYWGRKARKSFSPPLPPKLEITLNEDLYARIAQLARRMQQRGLVE